jgi:hypothetical protein
VLDDRRVEAVAGGDHADVGLRKLDDLEAFAFELERCLPEPPRVIGQFADRVAVGERPDVLDDFEDRAGARATSTAGARVPSRPFRSQPPCRRSRPAGRRRPPRF